MRNLLILLMPVNIAEYKLSEALPEEIKTNLPVIEELEAELAKKLEVDK